MRARNEDPKVGVLMIMMAPFLTINQLFRSSKRVDALADGLSVFTAGTLILVGASVAKISGAVRGVLES